jgi:transposase-like protein
MTKGLLSADIFHDETRAREWLEARLWKDGTICPRCGVVGEATLMKGDSHRPGLYQCNACRKPFTVTVGTLYERSHIPLHKWLAATQLLMSSKKGMSALQVGRMLGVSKKTAWFLCHRIRESVKLAHKTRLGGIGSIVEADETYHGPVSQPRTHAARGPYTKSGKTGPSNKRAIVALVERGGNVRSFHVPQANAENVAKIVNDNISHEAKLFTDESKLYIRVGENFSEHSTVNHSRKEYARG